MYTQNNDWISIDSKIEIKNVNGIKFIRPKGYKTLDIDCPKCKELISTIEDCITLKSENLCQECSINKSFSNKDNN